MDSNKPAITGLKKRQQIQKANKIVFIWVAIAGIVVSIALVLGQFMFKQLMYNNKVIEHQSSTNKTLQANIATYDGLVAEVNKLLANPRLNDLRVNKTPGGDNALQVVIDAMPTTNDQIALAASLQQAILNRSGVTVGALSFPEGASVVSADGDVPLEGAAEGAVVEVPFAFKVTGSYQQIEAMFRDIHLSIRPISITNIKMNGTNSAMTVDVQAKAYYAVPRTTDLIKEPINP